MYEHPRAAFYNSGKSCHFPITHYADIFYRKNATRWTKLSWKDAVSTSRDTAGVKFIILAIKRIAYDSNCVWPIILVYQNRIPISLKFLCRCTYINMYEIDSWAIHINVVGVRRDISLRSNRRQTAVTLLLQIHDIRPCLISMQNQSLRFLWEVTKTNNPKQCVACRVHERDVNKSIFPWISVDLKFQDLSVCILVCMINRNRNKRVNRIFRGASQNPKAETK